jgi:succinyl-CoA synthetase beta subunit
VSRLHESQGKALLQRFDIRVPVGGVADTPQAARTLAEGIGGPVVVKAQLWITGRAGVGGIRFAVDPDGAERAAADLLGSAAGRFTVERVLVEERLAIERELFVAITIDDRARAPLIVFAGSGGSGIEEAAHSEAANIVRQAVDVRRGFDERQALALVRQAGEGGELADALAELLPRLYRAARSYDAQTLEINPLALTTAGELVAIDCRFTIDDNAVYRHPELGIEVAREFDHPITQLERIAWEVERSDYRGTFYFVELGPEADDEAPRVGFHGSGGGGAMLAMDALLAQGLCPADFVDTSGNPPASKVYRAACIVLAQPGIRGYFASGSGVASQEQFHSARGLAKAFLEAPLAVPAVLRLGGNAEERALSILQQVGALLDVPLEGYGKDDGIEACAARMGELIDSFQPALAPPRRREPPQAVRPYRFETVSGGTVTLDHAACLECVNKVCIESCAPQILVLEGDVPVLGIGFDEAKRGGCTECLACDVTCYLEGNRGGYVSLPIAGLGAATP